MRFVLPLNNDMGIAIVAVIAATAAEYLIPIIKCDIRLAGAPPPKMKMLSRDESGT